MKARLARLWAVLKDFLERLDKWSRKPRVRLTPFYFTRIPTEFATSKPTEKVEKLQAFSEFPRDQIAEDFYTIISLEPQVCHILARYFIGYFKAEMEGIEVPDADVMLMWPMIHHRSSFPASHMKIFVFFVDGEYYAGDVIHEKTPEVVLRRRTPIPTTFHVRLLFKVHEPC